MIQQCFLFFFSCTLPVCLLLNIVLVFCYLPDFLVGGKNGCVFVADGLSRTCFSYRAQTFGASLGDFTTQPITHSGVFFFHIEDMFIRISDRVLEGEVNHYFMLHYCSSHRAGDSPRLPRLSIIHGQERIDELDQKSIN